MLWGQLLGRTKSSFGEDCPWDTSPISLSLSLSPSLSCFLFDVQLILLLRFALYFLHSRMRKLQCFSILLTGEYSRLKLGHLLCGLQLRGCMIWSPQFNYGFCTLCFWHFHISIVWNWWTEGWINIRKPSLLYLSNDQYVCKFCNYFSIVIPDWSMITLI